MLNWSLSLFIVVFKTSDLLMVLPIFVQFSHFMGRHLHSLIIRSATDVILVLGHAIWVLIRTDYTTTYRTKKKLWKRLWAVNPFKKLSTVCFWLWVSCLKFFRRFDIQIVPFWVNKVGFLFVNPLINNAFLQVVLWNCSVWDIHYW